MKETRPDPSTGGLISQPGEGSLRRGVGWAWLIVMMGNVILYGSAILVMDSLSRSGRTELAPWVRYLFYLPLVVAVVAAIVSILRGNRRTGIGIFIGLVAMAAVVLLLMAACFGLSAALSPHR
jgi:hypothetical protein